MTDRITEIERDLQCIDADTASHYYIDKIIASSKALLISHCRWLLARLREREEALKDAAEAICKIAYEIPAPNQYTPRLVQVAIQIQALAHPAMRTGEEKGGGNHRWSTGDCTRR